MSENKKHAIEQDKGQFLVYETENGVMKLDVRLENETVWLTQQLMANLFQSSKQNISHHINSIYEEGELLPEATVKKYLTVAGYPYIRATFLSENYRYIRNQYRL